MTQPGGEPCMENRSRMFFQLEAQTKGFVINASLGPGSAPGAAGRHGPPHPPHGPGEALPDFSPWCCQDGGQGAELSQAPMPRGRAQRRRREPLCFFMQNLPLKKDRFSGVLFAFVKSGTRTRGKEVKSGVPAGAAMPGGFWLLLLPGAQGGLTMGSLRVLGMHREEPGSKRALGSGASPGCSSV